MRTFNITVNGQTYVVDVEEVGGVQTAVQNGTTRNVICRPATGLPLQVSRAVYALP